MTKKEKPELPQLPPGKPCFPRPRAIKPTELDPKTLRTLSVTISELHRRNKKHAVRWMRVRAMEDMTPAAFKKKHGYKQTLSKMYELVAEAEGSVGPQAIKKSCDRVDAAIEAGNSDEFFAGDLPIRKLGKKRPRSR
jgi:hypothetical protein